MRETIEKQFVLDNLYCSSCAIKIENEIRSLDYIKNASLNFSTKNLHIETYADESDNVSEQIKKIIKEVDPTVNIAGNTKKIIWQNIALALGVKILVLLLGVFGIASMWSAVFADVGVTILAVLNATRMLKIKTI